MKTTPPAACRMPRPCEGRRAAIEVNISSDMPLPTPLLVMSSPSHMITAVPDVIVITMSEMLNTEGSRMIAWLQPGISRFERASATMPVDCRTARPIVR